MRSATKRRKRESEEEACFSFSPPETKGEKKNFFFHPISVSCGTDPPELTHAVYGTTTSEARKGISRQSVFAFFFFFFFCDLLTFFAIENKWSVKGVEIYTANVVSRITNQTERLINKNFRNSYGTCRLINHPQFKERYFGDHGVALLRKRPTHYH